MHRQFKWLSNVFAFKKMVTSMIFIIYNDFRYDKII